MTETERCINEINKAIGDIRTDIAVIKKTLNGGPGESKWCLEHAKTVQSFGVRLASVEGKLFKYAGGLTLLLIVLQVSVPFIVKVVFK